MLDAPHASLAPSEPSSVLQGEAKLMLKREEKGGLNVSLKQLNAIVRL